MCDNLGFDEDTKKETVETNCSVGKNTQLYQILYLIFDYPHKHYTFKHFEI